MRRPLELHIRLDLVVAGLSIGVALGYLILHDGSLIGRLSHAALAVV